MPAVTNCSDFPALENKVCHCFHCFPIYLPWSDGTRCHDLGFLNVTILQFLKIILNERSQSQKNFILWVHFYVSRKVRFIELESSCLRLETQVSKWGDGNVIDDGDGCTTPGFLQSLNWCILWNKLYSSETVFQIKGDDTIS